MANANGDIRPTGLFATADFDAVFVVKNRGRKHYIFASYEGGGGYQQWGAEREVLGLNVETVTAWAAHLFEERGE